MSQAHRNAFLTPAQVRAIKKSLWDGARIDDLATRYGVTDRAISNIRCGRSWPEIEWPNSSVGAIPMERRREIHKLRYAD